MIAWSTTISWWYVSLSIIPRKHIEIIVKFLKRNDSRCVRACVCLVPKAIFTSLLFTHSLVVLFCCCLRSNIYTCYPHASSDDQHKVSQRCVLFSSIVCVLYSKHIDIRVSCVWHYTKRWMKPYPFSHGENMLYSIHIKRRRSLYLYRPQRNNLSIVRALLAYTSRSPVCVFYMCCSFLFFCLIKVFFIPTVIQHAASLLGIRILFYTYISILSHGLNKTFECDAIWAYHVEFFKFHFNRNIAICLLFCRKNVCCDRTSPR